MANGPSCDHFKIVVIGDILVGKTKLVDGFVHDFDKSEYRPTLTVGINFSIKDIDVSGKQVKLQIWDTAGQIRYHAKMISVYYRGAHGFLLVYDVRHRVSFVNLSVWLKSIDENCQSKDVIKILVGNNEDPDKKMVSTEEAQAFAEQNGMQLFEISNNDQIKEMFLAFAKQALQQADNENDLRELAADFIKKNKNSKEMKRFHLELTD